MKILTYTNIGITISRWSIIRSANTRIWTSCRNRWACISNIKTRSIHCLCAITTCFRTISRCYVWTQLTN